MALILNIDTALDTASVCLAKDGKSIALKVNKSQKDHAAWIHKAIDEIVQDIKSLDAISVTIGPGSYTGLRVGLATAKGLCYALQLPLITIGTLPNMALSASGCDSDLLCPMIDARRMEVFTAVYDKTGKEIMKPAAIILDEDSYKDILKNKRVCFFGSGSIKFRNICKNDNALFNNIETDASSMITVSEQLFMQKSFADLAYSEPLYLKEFHS